MFCFSIAANKSIVLCFVLSWHAYLNQHLGFALATVFCCPDRLPWFRFDQVVPKVRATVSELRVWNIWFIPSCRASIFTRVYLFWPDCIASFIWKNKFHSYLSPCFRKCQILSIEQSLRFLTQKELTAAEISMVLEELNTSQYTLSSSLLISVAVSSFRVRNLNDCSMLNIWHFLKHGER